MGAVQNTLICMYLLTNKFPEDEIEVLVRKEDFDDMVMAADISMERYFDLAKRVREFYPDQVVEREGNLTFVDQIRGKVVASVVFPRTFTWSRKTDTNETYKEVKIRNGVILPDSGPLCKKVIGGTSNSAIHALWNLYSPRVAAQFLTEIQFISYVYIPRHGFSMGISDCLATKLDEVKKKIAEAKINCDMILASSKDENEKEREINSVLNDVMSVAPKLAKTSMNKGDRNNLVIMKKCGAKGSDINNGQIAGCVGQQNVDGGRMPFHLSNGTRALPLFKPHDISPAAKGFVENPYLTGLAANEVWFHAIGGRRGVVDTAMKTGETGYLQKKIGKKIEDSTVLLDGTIRDNAKNIIEFAYGDTMMNAKHLMYAKGLDFPFFVNPEMLAEILNSETILAYRDQHPKLSTAKVAQALGEPRSLTVDETNLLMTFITAGCPGIQSEVTERITYNVRVILRSILPKAKVLECAIPQFCGRVRDLYEQSKCHAGEMVGLIAASSIGEPTTQLTLNTFHAAGVSAKDVTLGVPRLKELLNATKNPSKPSFTITLDEELIRNHKDRKAKVNALLQKAEEAKKEKKIELLKKELEHVDDEWFQDVEEFGTRMTSVNIGTFIVRYELRYLPRQNSDEASSQSIFSPVNLITYEEYSPEWWVTLANDLGNSPKIEPAGWVIILYLNLEKMYQFGVDLETIADRIEQDSYGSRGFAASCVPSPNNYGQIEVYLNFAEINTYIHTKAQLPAGEISERGCLLTTDNVEFFTAREVAMEFIKKTQIRTLYGVSKTYPHLDQRSGEWLLDVRSHGANFLDILSTPGIDPTKTTSDNMWDIYAVLGIEAARDFLINEVSKILSFDGTYIYPAHVQHLINVMTRTGVITSANRDGIPRDVGPLAKCMFEKAVDNCGEAAAFTEKDLMTGVSAAVMFGTLAPVGTGLVEIKDAERMPVKRPPIKVAIAPSKQKRSK